MTLPSSTPLHDKPLIFTDALVPRRQRTVLATLTLAAWIGWLELWLPILQRAWRNRGVATEALRLTDAQYLRIVEQATLSATFFACAAVLFVGWFGVRFVTRSLLERLAARPLDTTALPLSSRQLAASFQFEHALLQQWQSAQVAIAHHADDTGWLRHVEPANATKFAL